MRQLAALLTLTVALTACSGVTPTTSIPSSASMAKSDLRTDAGSKPIIAPTYLYFEYVGQDQTFEVYGRKKFNKGRWKAQSTCAGLVTITFAGFNAQGSAYTAEAEYPGGYCTYTVTNPHGQQGSIEMYVSSD